MNSKKILKTAGLLLSLVMMAAMLGAFAPAALAANGGVVAWNDANGNGLLDSGETAYTNLGEALNAGGTVKMYADYDAAAEGDIAIGSGAAEKITVTLDLNGKSVTSDADWLLDIYNADVTVTDTGSAKRGALTTTGQMAICVNETSSKLTVAGGTIRGNNYGVFVYGGALAVEGGTLIGSLEGVQIYKNTCTCTVTGGSFSSDPSDYVAAGYTATGNIVTELWDVTEKSLAVRTVIAWNDTNDNGEIDSGETTYAAGELEKALNAGGVVKMYADYSFPEGGLAIGLESSAQIVVTLDLNGKSISSDAESLMDIYNADVTIVNGGAAWTASLVTSGSHAVYLNEDQSKLTVRGGKLEAGTYGIYANAGSAVVENGTVNGGTAGIAAGSGTCTVKGGSFSHNPSEFAAEDFAAVEHNGAWDVKPLAEARIEILENAVKALEEKISAQIDPAELAAAIKEVTDMIGALDEAYATDTAVAAAIEKAKTDVASAYTAALSDAVKALEAKISAQIDPIELAAAIKEVTDMIGALDDTYATDQAVAEAIATAKSALDASIDRVAKDLTAAKTELQTAISAGDTALGGKIESLSEALETAKAVAEAADQANKAELTAKMDEADAALKAAIDALSSELDGMKNELKKKDSQLQTFIIIVCVISCITLGGFGAFAVWFFLERKKFMSAIYSED